MGDYLQNLLDKACGYLGYQPFFCERDEPAKPVEEVSYCDEVVMGNSEAYQLCELLRGEGFTKSDIDTGLGGKVFRPPQESAMPNGQIEPQEIYHKAIEVMEDEIFSLGKISPEEEKNLFSYKAWQIGFRVPWLFYEADEGLYYEDNYFRVLLKNLIEGLECGYACFSQRELAGAIYDFAFSKEGFGIEVWNHLPCEITATKTLSWKFGDCTEISRVLYSLYRYAGFSPKFIWVRENSVGEPLLHMSLMINVDGQEVVVDSHYGFDAKHKSIEHLPLLTSLATYNNNLGNQERNVDEALSHLHKSLNYDPTYSLTYLYLAQKRFAGTSHFNTFDYLDRAFELDPASTNYLGIISTP